MVEGLGKGAGLALLAVPMDNASTFSQAQFQRIWSNFLGLEGTISIPHTSVLTIVAAVRCACSRRELSLTNCATDATDVETRLATADGSTYDAEVVYFDSHLQNESLIL
jgi:hypothetical protein